MIYILLLVLIITAIVIIFLYTRKENCTLSTEYDYTAPLTRYNRYGQWVENQPRIPILSNQPVLYDWTNDDGNHFYRY